MSETQPNHFWHETWKRIVAFLKSAGLFSGELVKVLLLAGITIFLVRHFLFKPFYVKGASMEPNFLERDYLIIDELTYRFKNPVRGEVVVFHHDNDYFIKRVVGLPGETVKVSEGVVTIFNSTHPAGFVLDESYLPKDLRTFGNVTVELGKDEFYVMGDNRDNSFDSRRFGPVAEDKIVGRVVLRGWPFDRASLLRVPEFKN